MCCGDLAPGGTGAGQLPGVVCPGDGALFPAQAKPEVHHATDHAHLPQLRASVITHRPLASPENLKPALAISVPTTE